VVRFGVAGLETSCWPCAVRLATTLQVNIAKGTEIEV
jgi:hypothetical protein